jgi:hypothetical protein
VNALVRKRASLSAAVTFRGNLRSTRHGWLRLTPAYSVQLVRELLERRSRADLPVLDPFCGTGTTLVACAEAGIACRTVDINPFLRWLAEAKSRSYSAADLYKAQQLLERMARAADRGRGRSWVPALHRIGRWWDDATLSALSRSFAELAGKRGKARDLAALAFCRTLIDVGHVSFRHQSMSFRKRSGAPDVAVALRCAFAALQSGAEQALPGSDARILVGDARQLTALLEPNSCGSVITSPPYCNRMSYIRELRPYMYWLGFLDDGRQAGELDWRAIGGTWGSATSQLATWEPEHGLELPRLRQLARRIGRSSALLARYVERYERYFHDMDRHVAEVARVIASGGELSYVIGNSKFFDVVVPAQALLVELFERHGFVDARTRVLRRRTSKKELFEYLVSARRK